MPIGGGQVKGSHRRGAESAESAEKSGEKRRWRKLGKTPIRRFIVPSREMEKSGRFWGTAPTGVSVLPF
jgi:hypothetical protein